MEENKTMSYEDDDEKELKEKDKEKISEALNKIAEIAEDLRKYLRQEEMEVNVIVEDNEKPFFNVTILEEFDMEDLDLDWLNFPDGKPKEYFDCFDEDVEEV